MVSSPFFASPRRYKVTLVVLILQCVHWCVYIYIYIYYSPTVCVSCYHQQTQPNFTTSSSESFKSNVGQSSMAAVTNTSRYTCIYMMAVMVTLMSKFAFIMSSSHYYIFTLHHPWEVGLGLGLRIGQQHFLLKWNESTSGAMWYIYVHLKYIHNELCDLSEMGVALSS